MSAAPLRQQRPIPRQRPDQRAGAPATGRASRSAAGARPSGPQRHLRPVAAPEQARSLMPFMWACILPVVGALAAVLLINTAMAEGAYERRDLKIEIAALHQEAETLSETLEANGAPEALAARAEQLGMAPATALGFMSLSDGIVLENGK
ncbi:hypothetical protein [Demequina lignilytica]|uniref:Cell division protein FtsL n=1 Tax=Demequina lignilytica TaxID=3051663 RepID=A0AB35MJK1_9MICO|nr:hypothetical protein [Demequina sp. SYSU T0a273]MDN4483969.1 hypothetical protein [Demequina sp. SYSU T0a273]